MARLPSLAQGHFIHHELITFDWQPSNTMATLPSFVPRGDFMHTDLNTHEWQNCNFMDPWLDERNFDYIPSAAQGGELEQGVIMSTNGYAKATDLVPAPSCNAVYNDMVPAADMVPSCNVAYTDMVPAAFLQGDGMTSYNADWPCWQCLPSPAIQLDSTFGYTINGTHAQDEQGAIMSISANTAANKVEVQSPPNPGDQHEEISEFANWPCWQPPPAPANGNQEFSEEICKASWSVEDKDLTQAEDADEKKTSAAPIALTRKPWAS